MASASVREKMEAYFSVLNSTAGRMMADLESVRLSHGFRWSELSYLEQSNALWRSLVHPDVEGKYDLYPTSRPEEEYFPVLRINPGEKIVVDDDSSAGKLCGCSWRDEHSAPFSWETQSQLDLRLIGTNGENQANREDENVENSSCHLKEKKEEEEEDEEEEEEEEGSSISTDMLPPAVACAVATPQILHSSLSEKKQERRAATLPTCHSHQDKFHHNSRGMKHQPESETDDLNHLSLNIDLHNPAHMTIPKTGFDFLDNW